MITKITCRYSFEVLDFHCNDFGFTLNIGVSYLGIYKTSMGLTWYHHQQLTSLEICLKTTGHEKVRISVCLSAKANGNKLKPFIVFGGAKREVEALNKEFRSHCVIVSSSNAWMNEEFTTRYVETVLGKLSFALRLLAWDSFECHIMDSIKKRLKDNKMDSVIIPGGCAKYLQAPDVSWNKPFKALLTEIYDAWLSDGIHQYTSAHNLKASPRGKIVEWVLVSWSKLPKEFIVKSFKVCGLNLPNDGSEDHLIYCFQKGTPYSRGSCDSETATHGEKRFIIEYKSIYLRVG